MVLKRITSNLKYKYFRNCVYKKNHSYLSALISCIKMYVKDFEILRIYKCPFSNHYHIGHYTNKTKKRYNNTLKNCKMTLLYQK